GVDAVDLVSGPVLDRYRQVRGRELLAKLRRERIEFRGEVVRDQAREMRCDVRGREEVELYERCRLISERDLLALTQIARGPGKPRHLGRLREEADVVRYDATCADTRIEAFDAAGVPLVPRYRAQIRGWVLGVVRVVGRSECRLVG